MEIRNPEGELLDYSRTEAVGPVQDKDIFVIGHGVTANKDRAWAVALADALAQSGREVVRFSFSGNGDSEGRFEDSCPSKEVRDLGAVLDAFPGRGFTYIGHSMGGAVGVLRTVMDERIMRLISLAGMVDTADFAQRKFGHQQPGDLMWDKPECPISAAFLEDMKLIGSVEPMAAQITVPWLFVHGTADTVVPLAESLSISDLANGAVAVEELDGVDHVFSGEAEQAMTDAVLSWLIAAESESND